MTKPVNARTAGIVRIRRETQGRRGKAVTVVDGLPLSGDALAALASELKKRCGAGGSAGAGCIEIQGDQRATVAEILRLRGFVVKLAGG